jgi:hypothetical protein
MFFFSFQMFQLGRNEKLWTKALNKNVQFWNDVRNQFVAINILKWIWIVVNLQSFLI